MKKIITIVALLVPCIGNAGKHFQYGVATSSLVVGSDGIRFNDGSVQTTAGGGGTPSGSNTQVQYNNSGSFGGSSNFTFNGTTLTVTGVIVASSGIVVGSGSEVSQAIFREGTAPSNPDANNHSLYFDSANQNKLTSKNSAGVTMVYSTSTSSGGSGSSAAPLCIITSSETISATGDFTLSGCSIPANTLTAGKVLRTVVTGFASTGATDGQVGFGLKYGSTDIQQLRTTYTGGSQTNNGFVGHFYNTVKTAGSSGAIYSEGSSVIESSAGTAGAFLHKITGTTTINTTATTTLYVTAFMPANATVTLTQFLVYVE